MDAGLRDRCYLVTGASGGIGRAIHETLLAEGAFVGAQYHRDRDGVDAVAGERSVPLQADLRDEARVDACFAELVAARGRVDGIVLNAGIWVSDDVPLHEMSLAQWDETLRVDLTAAFLVCRAFLRHLAEQPREAAAIVFVGSTAALFGEAQHADYAAAKAGLVHGLAPSLKNEIVALAPRGRVNSVCPGWVDTPMTAQQVADPALVERATSTMALEKLATPDDVAVSVAFLLSDRLSGHMSGAVLPVAGGMEGRRLK